MPSRESSPPDAGRERVPPPDRTDPASTHAQADLRKEVALDRAPKRDSRDIGIEADPQIGHGFGAAEAMKNDHELSSGFTCPECHGALWETADGRLVGYRCRVGHTFTQSGLLGGQGRALEAAMWTAYTALEEHVSFVHRLVARNEVQGNLVTVTRLNDRARDLEARARLIKNVLAVGPFAVATGEPQPTMAREA
jgi:two-component system chemotaxis response regulator CheB